MPTKTFRYVNVNYYGTPKKFILIVFIFLYEVLRYIHTLFSASFNGSIFEQNFFFIMLPDVIIKPQSCGLIKIPLLH